MQLLVIPGPLTIGATAEACAGHIVAINNLRPYESLIGIEVDTKNAILVAGTHSYW